MNKTRKLIAFLVLFYSVNAYAQSAADRITFLIVIDNDYPWSDIIDSKFIIKDRYGKTKSEIPFDYTVGKMLCNDSVYNGLFKIKIQDTLYIKFRYRNLARDSDITYEEKIDKKLINKEFMILKIFNKYNLYSNQRYIIPKNKGYVFQVIIPGTQTILNEKKRL